MRTNTRRCCSCAPATRRPWGQPGLWACECVAEDASPDDRVRRQAVLGGLASHRDWLLILDNADTPEAVRAADELTRGLRQGDVILTSRLTESPLGIESLGLDLMALDDAAQYLLTATDPESTATEGGRRVEPDDAAKARELGEALDRLTLALVHAAAYIRVTKMSFAKYLAPWGANRGKVLDWANEATTGYPLSLAQTWVTSVEQLTEAGCALLERLSFFANDPIPEFLLDVPLPGRDMAEGIEPLLDLQRFSLVMRDPHTDRFTVHRIVRDVTSRHLVNDPALRNARIAESLIWLNAAWVGNPWDARDWPRLNPLAPHAETVSLEAGKSGLLELAEPTVRLMRESGRLYHMKGQYDRAGPLYEVSLGAGRVAFGPDNPKLASHYTDLAILLITVNRLAEAGPLVARAIEMAEANSAMEDPDVAENLTNLAALYFQIGQFSTSEALYRRVLAANLEKPGPDDPQIAHDLSNLGQMLASTNRRTETEPMLRRAVAINEESGNTDTSSLASCLHNLAGLLYATNRLSEAEPLYRRALAINEKCFGLDQPQVAGELNNLGVILFSTGRSAEAEELLRRALAHAEKSVGTHHPIVAVRLFNLAGVVRSSWQEAESLMRRAIMIFLVSQRRTGIVHPHCGATIEGYVNLLFQMGQDEVGIRATIESIHREAGLG